MSDETRQPDGTPVRAVPGEVRDVVGAVLASAVRNELGIFGYDLEPPDPAKFPRVPAYSPFRRLAERPPQPRYVPLPVPAGHVRVEVDWDRNDDGFTWRRWDGAEAEYPARIFDVPAEQFARWEAARAAWEAAQEEIGALRAARLAEHPPVGRAGWTEKPGYQVQP